MVLFTISSRFRHGLVQGQQDIRRRIGAVCADVAILAVVRPHPPGRYLRPGKTLAVVGRPDCLIAGRRNQGTRRPARLASRQRYLRDLRNNLSAKLLSGTASAAATAACAEFATVRAFPPRLRDVRRRTKRTIPITRSSRRLISPSTPDALAKRRAGASAAMR